MPDGNAMFSRAAEGATREATPPDAKRPLTRELPPPPIFRTEALGPLRLAAEAIQVQVGMPVVIAAQSVLAAVTLAVQPHRDVELPGGGRKPLVGIFATVAESGERKSSCDNLALRAVHRYEEGLREQYEPAVNAYRSDKAAWEAATADAKKKGKGDRAAIRAALNVIGAEPKPPPHPMLLVADPTPEAIVMHLAGRPWGGLFTDEGGLLIGGHAMNDDNRMRTGALLNVLWDGKPIRRVRVGTGTLFLPGRRFSAHVMMQGTVAAKLFGDAMLGGMGTLARILTVAPETTAGTRLFREGSPVADAALADYDSRVRDLLTMRTRLRAGEDGGLDPEPMTLSADAKRLWVAFHDDAERSMGNDGERAAIRAFTSKLAEHAGRLAAVLATYADPETCEVSADAMAYGIELGQHYAAELLRLGEASLVSPDLALAQRLLTWWQSRDDPTCHLAAIYQTGPRAIREATKARQVATLLQDHGYIRSLPARTVLDGEPRREAWELVQ